jgi:hypothetical protein
MNAIYLNLSKKSRMTYDMEGLLNEHTVQSPILLDIMKRNLSTNSASLVVQPEVRELEWGVAYEDQLKKIITFESSYDLIVGSDLTYRSNTAQDLFWTVSRLLKDMTTNQDRHHNHKQGSEEDTTNINYNKNNNSLQSLLVLY